MNYMIITVDVSKIVEAVTPKTRYTEYLVEKGYATWYIIGTRNKYSESGQWHFGFKGYKMNDVEGEIVKRRELTDEELFAEML